MPQSTWNRFPDVKPEPEVQIVVFVYKPEQRAAFAMFREDGKFREVVKGKLSSVVLPYVSHWADMPG